MEGSRWKEASGQGKGSKARGTGTRWAPPPPLDDDAEVRALERSPQGFLGTAIWSKSFSPLGFLDRLGRELCLFRVEEHVPLELMVILDVLELEGRERRVVGPFDVGRDVDRAVASGGAVALLLLEGSSVRGDGASCQSLVRIGRGRGEGRTHRQ